MTQTLLAKRYSAGFLANCKEEDYNSLLTDVTTLRQAISNLPMLSSALSSFLTPKTQRLEIIDALASQLNNPPLWGGLFIVMAKAHRLKFLNHVINEIETNLLSRVGRIKMNLILARKHNNDVIDSIKNHFEKWIGKSIILDVTIDESIVGGFIGTIGSYRIDGSVIHSLYKFKRINN